MTALSLLLLCYQFFVEKPGAYLCLMLYYFMFKHVLPKKKIYFYLQMWVKPSQTLTWWALQHLFAIKSFKLLEFLLLLLTATTKIAVTTPNPTTWSTIRYKRFMCCVTPISNKSLDRHLRSASSRVRWTRKSTLILNVFPSHPRALSRWFPPVSQHSPSKSNNNNNNNNTVSWRKKRKKGRRRQRSVGVPIIFLCRLHNGYNGTSAQACIHWSFACALFVFSPSNHKNHPGCCSVIAADHILSL